MSYQVGENWYCNPSQLNMFMPGVFISQERSEVEEFEIKNKQPCGCEEAMKKCLNRENQNDSFCCDFDETSIYEYDCECLRQKKSCF